MSSFLEYKTEISGMGRVLASAWSNGDQALCAVATESKVVLVMDEGERFEGDKSAMTLERDLKQAEKLAWHPREDILAIGWDDGMVSLWSRKPPPVLAMQDNKNSMKNGDVHTSNMTLLKWSPCGTRLISGAADGLLVVWDTSSGRLKGPLCRYQKNGAVEHVVFRCPANYSQTLAQQQQQQQPRRGSGSFGGPPGGFQSRGRLVCPPFFWANSNGQVFFADDQRNCAEMVSAGLSLETMYYSHVNEYLCLLTKNVTMLKYGISREGKLTPQRKLKLSIKGNGSTFKSTWAGDGLLVGANNEPILRVWNLLRDENYVLPIAAAGHLADSKDVFTCISFNPRSRTLIAGTRLGRVCFWKYVGKGSEAENSDLDWEVLRPVETQLGEAVNFLVWGPGENLVSMAHGQSVSVIHKTSLNVVVFDQTRVVQMSSDVLYVEREGKGKKITTGIRIKGLALHENYLVLYNGKRVEIRDLSSSTLSVAASFDSPAVAAAVFRNNVYLAMGQRVEICNFSGITKSVLNFSEVEGAPAILAYNGHYLAAASNAGVLKLWDIRSSRTKQIVPSRRFDDELPGGVIKSIRVNCYGSKISLLMDTTDAGGVQIPSTAIHVYDVELDKLYSHEFGPNFYPVSHAWDPNEEKLLAVETNRINIGAATTRARRHSQAPLNPSGGQSHLETKEHKSNTPEYDYGFDEEKGGTDDKIEKAEITTMFATTDNGILMQDSFPVASGDVLLGINVPDVIYVSRPTDDNKDGNAGAIPNIATSTMRDFVGLSQISDDNKKDLMEFSYHLTVGNMDEAYRAVKKISSNAIWENMARMCVKTKRLDVAEVCLGNMNNARGARAVREAKEKEPEKDAQVAMLAIQLGLVSDAERLYRDCKRWDLLLQLYIASGRWKDALQVCAKHARIHLKSTHYRYAKHLEAIGDTKAAIANYEQSDTHQHEVPRMLFDLKRIKDLGEYIKRSNDSKLTTWWAQYCESNSRYDEAIQFYSDAGNVMEQVRVHCLRGDDDKAVELCRSSMDMAACYHLARQYENQERIKEAITFYGMAKRHNHGIRLAKEHNLNDQLLTIALESSDLLQIEAARYFKRQGDMDKAVLLFHKGGKLAQAMDLCFKNELYDSLRTISGDLGPNTDPALLARCGQFFLKNEQFDKAVALFVQAGEHKKALALCIQHDVKVTEDFAEKMTPKKTRDPTQKKARAEVLLTIAQVCRDQGSYHLACKKYTQAGDKIRAMKCLLRTHDTDKIIYYAGMTKKKEIYILAANYLQNVDWHNDSEIMKAIISFYTKARALSQLSAFYDACAQVEIDEYRDYEKALAAMKESQKYLQESKDSANKDNLLYNMQVRIGLINKFVNARKALKTNPREMITLCREILAEKEVENAIRVGDVYALMIEYFNAIHEYQEAYNTIEKMKASGIITKPYIDDNIIRKVYDAVGASLDDGNDDFGGIDEDIAEDIPSG